MALLLVRERTENRDRRLIRSPLFEAPLSGSALRLGTTVKAEVKVRLQPGKSVTA
jgi:hypothetical protein